MKNFAKNSKFYLLHKNIGLYLLDMPIIWLTFSGLRCIIIGIEEMNRFLAKIGIYSDLQIKVKPSKGEFTNNSQV